MLISTMQKTSTFKTSYLISSSVFLSFFLSFLAFPPFILLFLFSSILFFLSFSREIWGGEGAQRKLRYIINHPKRQCHCKMQAKAVRRSASGLNLQTLHEYAQRESFQRQLYFVGALWLEYRLRD